MTECPLCLRPVEAVPYGASGMCEPCREQLRADYNAAVWLRRHGDPDYRAFGCLVFSWGLTATADYLNVRREDVRGWVRRRQPSTSPVMRYLIRVAWEAIRHQVGNGEGELSPLKRKSVAAVERGDAEDSAGERGATPPTVPGPGDPCGG